MVNVARDQVFDQARLPLTRRAVRLPDVNEIAQAAEDPHDSCLAENESEDSSRGIPCSGSNAVSEKEHHDFAFFAHQRVPPF